MLGTPLPRRLGTWRIVVRPWRIICHRWAPWAAVSPVAAAAVVAAAAAAAAVVTMTIAAAAAAVVVAAAAVALWVRWSALVRVVGLAAGRFAMLVVGASFILPTAVARFAVAAAPLTDWVSVGAETISGSRLSRS